ncbi:Multidrug resistance efflux pump [Saccharicrinis carchari]|uniref:Multidrug resistance efflux pump n=1 Tax=Saccharicrinis carchari TaxID=1168039 RepID=A0A521EDF6_SACCC|nr:efflux RND transporter periplasmic adaptor subunit [Saccharicrinis carchari]SMO81220.1 Multidrug resistance efflux pump [Saccharicrinis carchari]
MLNKIPKKYVLTGAAVLLFMILIVVFWPASVNYQTVRAQIMPFAMEVAADGEVQALEFESINIPEILSRRDVGIWRMKISDLVTEGTQVKKGDFVASLDPSEVEERLVRIKERIEEHNNSLESAILDSTIQLMQKREELTNAKDNLEESLIRVEQSQYESKATQRQAGIALEKAQLEINAKLRNYDKEVLRQKIKINRIKKYLSRDVETKDLLEKLKSQLRITSPSNGIVVYGRSYRGRKIKVDDDVGPWMPIIATIPDLSSLYSEAIVKEIDIAKVKVGQPVQITIDAFPEFIFQGEIKNVANIGQPIPGTSMNGFKVVISFDTKGKKVLPGMTTANKITIASYSNDIVVPREAVFGNDTAYYVFKKQGGSIIKTRVQLGGENETHIRIVNGLQQNDKVLMARPDEYIEGKHINP